MLLDLPYLIRVSSPPTVPFSSLPRITYLDKDGNEVPNLWFSGPDDTIELLKRTQLLMWHPVEEYAMQIHFMTATTSCPSDEDVNAAIEVGSNL